MQTVAETPLFVKQAAELFSEDERKELIDFLAGNPQVGDEIPDTGGVCKMRFGSKGKGKRGGARVIYYWYSDDALIYALLAYGKKEKVDLKPDEAKAVAAFAKAIKAAHVPRFLTGSVPPISDWQLPSVNDDNTSCFYRAQTGYDPRRFFKN